MGSINGNHTSNFTKIRTKPYNLESKNQKIGNYRKTAAVQKKLNKKPEGGGGWAMSASAVCVKTIQE